MTSSADAYTFDFSTSAKNQQPIYTSKQWTYQVDQNNGNYQSNQVIFDLSGFYNSQRFINPQEMFLAIPVVTTLSSIPRSSDLELAGQGFDGLGASPSGTVTNASRSQPNLGNGFLNGAGITDQFATGFKSGYWNLINSLQIQVDGKDVVQLTPYLNYLASFEAITTWSQSDVAKYGSIEGFLPDKSNSWQINGQNTRSNVGYGVCNNVLPPVDQPSPYPNADKACNIFNPALASNKPSIWGSWLAPKISAATQYATAFVNDSLYERMKQTNCYYPQKHIIGYPSAPDYIVAAESAVPFPGTAKYAAVTKTANLAGLSLDSYMTSETISVTTVPVPVITQADTKASDAFRQTFTTCIVRFKSVCNLFDKLPLTRGLYMRIIVGVNTGYVKQYTCGLTPGFNNVGGVAAPYDPARPQSFPAYVNQVNTFANTCPIMLAPLQVSIPSITLGANPPSYDLGVYNIFDYTANPVTAAPGNAIIQLYPGLAVDSGCFMRQGVVVSCSIATPDPIHRATSGALSELADHQLNSCRVYAPVIDMEPDLVTQYITQYKQQAIYYRDTLWFSQLGVLPGATFNTPVGNGFVNLQRLIIMPFYHDDTPQSWPLIDESAGNSAPSIPFEPTSLWSTAPATVAPQASIVNFNVMVSNVTMFQRPVSYSFENFLEEMGLCNAINGGLDTGLTSGLIDYNMWCNNYRYYVVDISRRLAGDNSPKSVTVTGLNNTALKVDYYYFLQYRRHLTIDVESGHISVSSN
jgi:hypothetical protein